MSVDSWTTPESGFSLFVVRKQLLPELSFSQQVLHTCFSFYTDEKYPFKVLSSLSPPVGPENRGGMLIRDVGQKEETQSDQQMRQEECLEVHPRAAWRLSGRQLVLLRGLLLLAVLVILLVGILVKVYVRVP